MPLLLIDAGNTRVKWATAAPRGAIRLRGNIATEKCTVRWASDLAGKFPDHRVIVASVVPAASRTLRKAFGKRALFVTAESSALRFHYPRPRELGADRLAAAVAVGVPAIIISCGTATAVSVLDPRGRFCGGVIAPGLETQLSALLGATAQLPRTSLRPVPSALGRSTIAAIRAGVLLSFQGGVREIVQRLRAELKTKCPVILTGGHASLLRDLPLDPMELRPLLVFEGLHIMGQRLTADP